MELEIIVVRDSHGKILPIQDSDYISSLICRVIDLQIPDENNRQLILDEGVYQNIVYGKGPSLPRKFSLQESPKIVISGRKKLNGKRYKVVDDAARALRLSSIYQKVLAIPEDMDSYRELHKAADSIIVVTPKQADDGSGRKTRFANKSQWKEVAFNFETRLDEVQSGEYSDYFLRVYKRRI